MYGQSFYENSLCVKTVVFPKHIFNRKLQNIFIFQLEIVTVSRCSTAARGVWRRACVHVRSSTNGPCAAFEPSLHSLQNTARLVADPLSVQNYNV